MDKLRWNPQGVDDAQIAELRSHFDDAQICELGYVVMVYAGAQSFLSSIDFRVWDEDGRDLSERDGYPLVSTLSGELAYRDDV